MRDSDCPILPANEPNCDRSTGTCYKCTYNSDCKDPLKPNCLRNNGRCIAGLVWTLYYSIQRSGMIQLYYFIIFINNYCKRRHETKTQMPREGHQDWHGGTTVCGKRSQAGRHSQCFSPSWRAEGPREACTPPGENLQQQLPWSARGHGPRVVRRGDKRKRWLLLHTEYSVMAKLGGKY